MAERSATSKAARARAARRVLSSPPQCLVSAWLYQEMLEHGRTVADALEIMNGELETNYDVQQVMTWKRSSGKSRPTRRARDWLLRRTLLFTLKMFGFSNPTLTADQWTALVGRLQPLAKDGEDERERRRIDRIRHAKRK